jgi:hypothetical protein
MKMFSMRNKEWHDLNGHLDSIKNAVSEGRILMKVPPVICWYCQKEINAKLKSEGITKHMDWSEILPIRREGYAYHNNTYFDWLKEVSSGRTKV